MNLPQPVLDAAKRGFSVIPVGIDKKPYLSWKHLQDRAASLKELEAWQAEFTPAGWAIITGAVSGVVVLDFDGTAGLDLLKRLGLNPHVRTGSGGHHVYFQHPGWPVQTVNGKTKRTLGQRFRGLDIRADGGYGVFWGRNEEGEYKILRDLVPDPIDIIPPDLRDLLGLAAPPAQITSQPPSTAKITASGPQEAPTTRMVNPDLLIDRALEQVARGEGRNNVGFALACQLRDNGYHEADAAAVLQRFAASVGALNTKGAVEPYEEKDAIASLRQAYARSPRDPWSKNSSPRPAPDLKVLEGLVERARESSTALDPPDVIRALAWLSVKEPGKYDDICRKLRKVDVGKQAYEPRVREEAKLYLAAQEEQDLLSGLDEDERFGPFTAWRSIDGIYQVSQGKTYFISHDRRGRVIKQCIANFIARIAEEIALDDGVDVNRFFLIDGMLHTGQSLPLVRVPVSKFNAMTWHTENWGLGPTVFAGMSLKDHTRVAITEFSGNGAPRRKVFIHLGWRRLPGGDWVFLHAGGAVGADNLSVDIEAELQKYSLPPEQGDVREAMRLSLSILELGDPRIVFPLWAAVWRAPLCEWLPFLLVLWLLGESGTMKSTMAALVLSHFGGPFDKDHLPASWLDTENRLEQRAFLAKDSLLVVDDYFPEKHSGFAQELERRASRFIRSIGNRQGRGRLRSDLTARKAYFPRGLVLSTAEQIPNLGLSAIARIFPIPFEMDAINKAKLTELQGKTQVLPHSMRQYLMFIAPLGDSLQETLRTRFEELRARARVEGHARLPEAVAQLYIGLEFGVGFAVSTKAINEAESKEILSRGWDVFMDLAQEHGRVLREERPTKIFLQAIQEALASGRAFLADRETGHSVMGGMGTEKIGWRDDAGIYLLPTTAYGLVSRLLQHRGGLTLTERALRAMLWEDGIILKKAEDRHTHKVRCEGKPVHVLWLRPDALGGFATGEEEGETDAMDGGPPAAGAQQREVG